MRRARAAERGFSMMEMLAALAVIGIMAAYATPAFIDVMRDRRVNQAGMQVADLYRLARTRAMDRGSAVLVRWQSATKTLTVMEAVTDTTQVNGGNPNVLPTASCLMNAWNLQGTTTQFITQFSPESIYHELASAEMRDIAGNAIVDADVCFTPRGRTFARFGLNNAMAPLTGVPRFRITNTLNGAVRTVLIPPTGGARLTL
jgi:type IV fimbrial biogenesis protein FimT